MGRLQDDIAKLIDDSYARGSDGQKIAHRLVQAGLKMMLENGEIGSGNHLYVSNSANGGFEIGKRPIPAGDDLRTVAILARDTFDEYAGNHLAKEPPQIEKAKRNIEMAASLSGALGVEYAAPALPDEAPEVDYTPGVTSYSSMARSGDLGKAIIFDDPQEAAREPQEADSALPPPETGVQRLIAIRDALDEGRYDDIYDLLDRVIVIGDADIPAFLRGLAGGALRHKMSDTATAMMAAAESIEKGLHIGLEDEAKALREITTRIGEANYNAGWWTDANLDLRTCDYALHVVMGKLLLVHSEVSEAAEGWRKSKKTILMDDHLTHRPMVEVEIADAHIRLFDLGANIRMSDGSLLDVPGAIIEKLAYNAQRADHKPENRAKEGGKAA